MGGRFRAPRANEAVLADPPFAAVPGLVERNRRLLNVDHPIVGGIPLHELRQLARRELIGLAREYVGDSFGHPPYPTDGPLLLSGHQPELSHPGVWVKNFALNGLARQLGGVPLNLIVDNDTLKTPALRLPAWSRWEPTAVHSVAVPFDARATESPYALREVQDGTVFAAFPAAVAEHTSNWPYEPMLARVWEDVTACHEPIGERFAAARRATERRWGCHNLELPVSLLTLSEAYARFVGHILLDLPRFREAYNAAIRRYRAANDVYSRNHPAPELERSGSQDEAPFWAWCYTVDDRRARVLAWRDGELLRAHAGGTLHFSADIERFVREWPELAESGTTIVPRALTLTLFARLCVGDLFLHGIGGGKYDEVTDDLIRTYFDTDPPAYQVLSATLHLPLPHFPAADVPALERLDRELTWNVVRHLPADDPVVREHRTVVATEPATRRGRRERFRTLRRLTEQLRPRLAERLDETRRELAAARQAAAANAVLTRRDYSWVLYPEETLRPFLTRFLS